MPRLFKPAIKTAGPGSAMAATNQFAKKDKYSGEVQAVQRKTTPPSSRTAVCRSMEGLGKAESAFIGMDLLDWVDEDRVEKRSANDKVDRNSGLETSKSESFHRNIGFDCRCPVPDSMIGADLCQQFMKFTRTQADQGAKLHHVAYTVSPNDNAKNATGIQVIKVDHLPKDDLETWMKPLSFGSLGNHCTGYLAASAKVPRALRAKYSWKILGEMVKAFVMEAEVDMSNLKLDDDEAIPLKITLVTSDHALFCDTNESNHSKAVSDFLAQTRPFFQDNRVASIMITVVDTGSLALSSSGQEPNDLEGQEVTAWRKRQLLAMTKCVHAIQSKILTHTATISLDDHLPTADLRFLVIDNCPAGYQHLSHEMRRSSYITREAPARLEVELPELNDGARCSVIFDANYVSVPAACSNVTASCLRADLTILTNSKVDVIQALPHGSIDIGILFGLPIELRPAICADFNSTQEMQVLARSLFTYLEKHDLALLLSSSTYPGHPQTENLLFRREKQMFLLLPQRCRNGESQTGLLFAVAQGDDLCSTSSPIKRLLQVDMDLENQYNDYTERAIETIVKGPYQPFHT